MLSIYESVTPLNSDLLGDQQGSLLVKLNLTFFPRVKKNNRWMKLFQF